MKNGFSFLLVSVALVVGALSFSNSIRLSSDLKYTIQEKETAEKMQKIENALISFVSKNGRLPCPALLSNKLEDFAFGAEAVDASFKCLNANTKFNIASGMVPIKTLGLAISDIKDGYGNKIGYTASLSLTKSINLDSKDNYMGATGNIIVQTDAGKILTKQAAFVVVSDGKNKSSEAKGNVFTSGSSEKMDDIILFKEKDQLVSSCLSSANAVNCSLAACSNSASAFNWSNSSIGYINQKPALTLDGKVDLPKLSLDSFRQSNQFQLQFTAEVEKATKQEIILYYTYALRDSPTKQVTEKLLTLNQSSSGPIKVAFGAYDHLPGTLFFKLADPSIKDNLRIRLYDLKLINILLWQNQRLVQHAWNSSFNSLFALTNTFNAKGNASYINLIGGASGNYVGANRIFGYLTPAKSGSYIFSITDTGGGTPQLYLSTSEYEGDKRLITLATSNSGRGNSGNGNNGNGNSGNGNSGGSNGQSVSLTAGKSYFIEVIAVSSKSASNSLTINWSSDGGKNFQLIPSSTISTYPVIYTASSDCKYFYETSIGFQNNPSSQTAASANLNNTLARYVKLEMIGVDKNYLSLRKISFETKDGTFITPTAIKVFRYSDNYSDTSYLNLTPINLISNLQSNTQLKNMQSMQDAYNQSWIAKNKSWVIFDLGSSYQLSKMHIWNGNSFGTLVNGAREVKIELKTFLPLDYIR